MNRDQKQASIKRLQNIVANPQIIKIEPDDLPADCFRPCNRKTSKAYINAASNLISSATTVMLQYADALNPREHNEQLLALFRAITSHMGSSLHDLAVYGYGSYDEWEKDHKNNLLNLPADAVHIMLQDMISELEERIKILQGHGRDPHVETIINTHMEDTVFDRPLGMADIKLEKLFSTANQIKTEGILQNPKYKNIDRHIPLAQYNPDDDDPLLTYKEEIYETMHIIEGFIDYLQPYDENDPETELPLDSSYSIEEAIDENLPYIAKLLYLTKRELCVVYGLDPDYRFSDDTMDEDEYFDDEVLIEILTDMKDELYQTYLLAEGEMRTDYSTEIYRYLNVNPYISPAFE